MDDDVSCSQEELVRLAWAARRDTLARAQLLQGFQSGADFYAALSSPDILGDPFVAPGDCVAAIVIRELTDVGEAEAWLHTLFKAHELRQDLPPAVSAACKGKRRF